MKLTGTERLVIHQKNRQGTSAASQKSELLPSSTSDENLHDDNKRKYYQIRGKNMKPYII